MVKAKRMLQVDQIERATGERHAPARSIKGAEAKREFLLAVQASGLQKHHDSFARNSYGTTIERATRRLKLGRIAWAWRAYDNWRRGLARPPQWVAQALADRLRADAAADLALADALEKDVAGPKVNGGAEVLRKWHARQKMEREKEKAAEAALRAKIESEG
jgi:hypothetical protein